MSNGADVRCPNCGQLIPASSIWAINRVCSECLKPLNPGAGRRRARDDAGEAAVGAAEQAIVRSWFEAFNGRDLDGMLAGMHPRVDFHPLRLHGIDSAYHGHDGIRAWAEQLDRLEHRHRVDLTEVRPADGRQLIAVGSLSAADPGGPSSFWALERFDEGKIVAAYHYLTDPEILREGGLLEL